ncbi:MAG: polysaccharide deacetylase family protein [Bryobacteraceae bacterium]
MSFWLTRASSAPVRQAAITIDDLPLGGDRSGPCEVAYIRQLTEKLLKPFRAQHIPLIGFVNEGRCGLSKEALRRILDLWLDSGAELGNHTYSHADLNTTPLAGYEADIEKGEPVLHAALADRGLTLRYFRHPFLRAGTTLETKRALEQYLASRGYFIAPVTLDNSDYMFAAVYAAALERNDRALAGRVKQAYVPYMESICAFFEQRSVEVAGHEIPQILLIHVNRLNSETMPALLAMMRARGYRFISLEHALEDPAYNLPDNYAGTGGFSWIHRWSKTKGMSNKGEPDEPAFITKQWQALQHAH